MSNSPSNNPDPSPATDTPASAGGANS
ncbi:hypothetical protein GA0115259_101921, partial [Streptomyces sp. MnatMP-M17]